MNERELLQALDVACPGAPADFILRHIEAKTDSQVAQQEWCGILFDENADLRQKVASLEAALAEKAAISSPTITETDDLQQVAQTAPASGTELADNKHPDTESDEGELSLNN